ncbi:8749_t:CDS:1 [Cetraspora pellucida]|uniref:8749_t:CDS:1 n=1 Tax=Cetraspora pellucida TaxID=1433469 RepID=A0ACA9M5E8_9GLOM|nr:8749_t:CDS:1 [Cetraspora pellucida]
MEVSPETTNEVINILVIGQTGVGKSTFINAFANYLKFSSLDDAKSGDLEVLIPSKIEIEKDNKSAEVTVGEGDNDEAMQSKGDSLTQRCKSYKFYTEKKAIRLIDTPGIGDTRGKDKDMETLENIMAYIKHSEHLNGICILLKPNESRLDDSLKYCIEALLSQFHKNVKDNIIFCFTHTKKTNYQPGDTLNVLKKLLKDLKVEIKTDKSARFCFDNEAFKFVAKYKNGMQFNKRDALSTEWSWEQSVDETQRLLKYIASLPPLNINDTVSLYSASVIVSNLVFPFIEIIEIINKNKIFISKQTTELEETIKRIKNLSKNDDCKYILETQIKSLNGSLYSKEVKKVKSPLNPHRIKCKHCISYSYCHKKCQKCPDLNDWLTGTVFYIPKAFFICDIYDFLGNCKKCGCRISHHYCEESEIIEKREEVINERVKAAIEEMEKEIRSLKPNKGLEEEIEALKSKDSQLDNELGKIKDIKEKFIEFLISNTLSTYDDKYLKLLQTKYEELVNEPPPKQSNEEVAHYATIKSLKKEIDEHEVQVERIKRLLPISSRISSDNIFELEKDLYKLKFSGKQFEDIKEKVEKDSKNILYEEKSINCKNFSGLKILESFWE